MSATRTSQYYTTVLAHDEHIDATPIAASIVERMGKLRPLRDGDRLLDVGCATGAVSAAFARHGLVVTGVDVVPEFVDAARRRGSDATFAVANAQSLPLPDGSFEYVVALGVLERVADWVRTLEEVTRVLVPGGVLYLVTTNRFCPRQFEIRYAWGFSYLPPRVRERLLALIVEHRPQLVGYTSSPARHWFWHGQLARELVARGLTPFHKYSLMQPDEIPARFRPWPLRKAIELLIRHPLPAMYPFDPITTIVAQKRDDR
jgi:ubiquinone/menaquinone biosynthesis C-methylase UbiE